ncbi:phosphoribosyl-AMP cyclohydrolase [Entomobacter blattae]|uniref:Phosphoribosyl-AMP cyclohydrolase n=1 Tax=Entomobacter blattae TaxID=2762277 RepID=A0A7H1NSR3_9PROT|nr:phosphoribosyl-AMP cyclohydrolase [Entomobacter blattae]QNT78823.1 Phosphoribosyl-AMP cyclohydrolase [Entomobacter blattae]
MTSYTPPSEKDINQFIDMVSFNADGLASAIAQQHDTKKILMQAWVNRDSLYKTLATGQVCYFSRSRQKLWTKGETSGQTQELIEARLDCDGDSLLLLVHQNGVACHTGRTTCFFNALTPEGIIHTEEPLISPEKLYGHHPHPK